MASRQLLSPPRVRRTVSRIACEIVERNQGREVIVFGLKRRGVALAEQLADALYALTGQRAEVHPLDVTPFRDDRQGEREAGPPAQPALAEDRDVVLVDDVLYTGRTARAALDAVLRYGRPRSVQLAVLIDRGHREVPVQPDYVGRVVPTTHRERVRVELSEPAVYIDE
ncbi:MAG: bifunctional pyr operon transcriptional regulator/uracil phosphoribosyltransferase PyrR [Rubricoccaceae bacterium]